MERAPDRGWWLVSLALATIALSLLTATAFWAFDARVIP